MNDFRKELESLINRHSKENESNTPDFILADYLVGCLETYDHTVNLRDKWYGVELCPGVERTASKAEIAKAILLDIKENVMAQVYLLGKP